MILMLLSLLEYWRTMEQALGSKRSSADFIDLKVYEPGMRYLIDNYIEANNAQKLGVFDDFTLADVI